MPALQALDSTRANARPLLPATRSQSFAWLFWCVAAVAGILDVWLLIGWREINPLNLSWLKGDAAQYEIGWEFLRHEAHWTFPLTWVTRLDYPSGVSVSNLDCIPLVAMLLRPFGPLLPQNFQYLGLYAVACYVLQAYFGLRLVSLFAEDDLIVTLLGSCFFLIAPILTLRLYGHFPHSSQWIILACLYYYFRWPPKEGELRSYLIPFVALSALAAAITPYFALMAVLFGFAALLRACLESKPDDREATMAAQDTSNSARVSPIACAKWGLLLLLGTCASLIVFGFIVFPSPQFAGDGYTLYSLNLLSPLNPGDNALYFKNLPVIGDGQRFEGYNYLGMGIILLLILVIARKPAELRELWSKTLQPLTIASVVFILLALSVRVTFGNHILFTVPLPRFLFNLLAAFRASGRLFWPVHYLLVLAAVAGVVTVVPSPNARRAILATALVIQYFDLVPLRDGVAAAARALHPNPLVSNDWPQAVTRHRHLVILPALQCGQESSPGGLEAWPYFARLVARSGGTLNSAYLGRISPQTIDLDCRSAPADLVHDGPRRDTAYVLDEKLVLSVLERPQLSYYCRRVDGFNLCTYDPAHSKKSRLLMDVIAPVYELGTEFRSERPTPKSLLLGNFDARPGWGRWTTQEFASIDFRLQHTPRRGLLLKVEVENVNVSDRHPLQRAFVSVNRRPVGELDFRFPEKRGERSVVIPAALVRKGSLNEIRLDLPDAVAPRDLGINQDGRLLALYIHRFRISDLAEKQTSLSP